MCVDYACNGLPCGTAYKLTKSLMRAVLRDLVEEKDTYNLKYEVSVSFIPLLYKTSLIKLSSTLILFPSISRYSDFMVHEIDRNGCVVTLDDVSVPLEQEDDKRVRLLCNVY